MPLEHWMMFSTFAEQNYFVYPRSDIYKGVIINANMAAHAPAGLASFIIGKLHSDTKYIVDPITHAFQHDPAFIKNKDGKPKASIQKLADAYGSPVAIHVGKRPLLPSHIETTASPDFARRVLDFQRNHLRAHMMNSDAAKYLADHEIKRPAALVAPYFYLTETEWEDWLPINLRCIQDSVEALADGERLFAEIVIDRGVLLDPAIRQEVLTGYGRFREDIAGCLLWIDNFDEQDVPIVELKALKKFCSELKESMPEVINLHGGYFSIMLGGSVGGACLTGVTHGPEFGEFRSVVPVGGGIPIARYYIPRLHSRVRYREAADLFTSADWLGSLDDFRSHVCDCEECMRTLEGDAGNFTRFGEGEVKSVRRGRGMVRIEFPSSATKLRCLRHYLQRKAREYQVANDAADGVALAELEASIKSFGSLIGPGGIDHLVRWRKTLAPSVTAS
jgi:hypothetical protein